jgi:hypothetical protein
MHDHRVIVSQSVFEWPEYHALARKLGIVEDVSVHSSEAIFKCPEYRAFAARLGIPDDQTVETAGVSMTLEFDSVVKIEHLYFGVDTTKPEIPRNQKLDG